MVNNFPDSRHDGTSFHDQPADGWRRKVAGKAVGVRAVLCERRADWALHKEVREFPRRSAAGSICCLCSWLKDELKFFDHESLPCLIFAHTDFVLARGALS